MRSIVQVQEEWKVERAGGFSQLICTLGMDVGAVSLLRCESFVSFFYVYLPSSPTGVGRRSRTLGIVMRHVAQDGLSGTNRSDVVIGKYVASDADAISCKIQYVLGDGAWCLVTTSFHEVRRLKSHPCTSTGWKRLLMGIRDGDRRAVGPGTFLARRTADSSPITPGIIRAGLVPLANRPIRKMSHNGLFPRFGILSNAWLKGSDTIVECYKPSSGFPWAGLYLLKDSGRESQRSLTNCNEKTQEWLAV